MDDEQYTDEFYNSFMSAGSVNVECDCGRIFVATDGLDYLEDEEIESLRKLKEEYPDKVLYWDCDSISWTWLQGKQMVFDCPCGIDKIFKNALLEHKTQILKFFKSIHEIELKKFETDDELLKNAT